jgi:hypothetical protein
MGFLATGPDPAQALRQILGLACSAPGLRTEVAPRLVQGDSAAGQQA